MTKKILIIVESPSKCALFEKYLGNEYICLATYGHLRELKSLDNIIINNDCEPLYNYNTIDNKNVRMQIKKIKNEYKKSKEIILATDNDREGEAIAWHLCDILYLNVNTTKRIIFNEITETSLKNAISNPTKINMNIVNAQKARQIIDILVGYKISPILWKYISKNKKESLSAGRCQIPALNIIYDNDVLNKGKNINQKYNINGFFTEQNIKFTLNKSLDNENDVNIFLENIKSYDHYLCESNTSVKTNTPPIPFNTSLIQQTASNLLNYSPKKTMQCCQKLYEKGYITYMRTTSNKYNAEFVNNISKYIINIYGDEYINNCLDGVTSDDKSNDSHEAIRITDFSLLTIDKTEYPDEYKIYNLIWSNTIKSCMSNATYKINTFKIPTYNNLYFMYKEETVTFLGWNIIDKNNIKTENYKNYLNLFNKKNKIKYNKVVACISFENVNTHYTESRLINILESKGIGRPSTYSNIVETLKERKYIKKTNISGTNITCNEYELTNNNIIINRTNKIINEEKNKLIIQPLGIIIRDFLNEHFYDFFNYEYTKYMEEQLDNIVNNNSTNWYDICNECNTNIDVFINKLKNNNKLEYKIDDNNTYIIGKYGPVIKSIDYDEENNKKIIHFKPVRDDINIDTLKNNNYEIDDIVYKKSDININHGNDGYLGEYNNFPIYVKKGKFGLYAVYNKENISLKQLGNRPIENIRIDDVIPIIKNTSIIRIINKNIYIIKGNVNNDYIYYKNDKMKKPLFYKLNNFNNDYEKCDLDIIQKWIHDTYKII